MIRALTYFSIEVDPSIDTRTPTSEASVSCRSNGDGGAAADSTASLVQLEAAQRAGGNSLNGVLRSDRHEFDAARDGARRMRIRTPASPPSHGFAPSALAMRPMLTSRCGKA